MSEFDAILASDALDDDELDDDSTYCEGWPEWWDMPDIPDELWPACITCGDPMPATQLAGGNVQCFECWLDSTTPLP